MIRLLLLVLVVGVRDAGTPPRDPWDFDGLVAKGFAQGDATDEVGRFALTQLGMRLEGEVAFKVSAHPNTVGGVTLTLEDPQDPKVSCALYASRGPEGLTFKDTRCSFPIFTGEARTQATCRRISGTARRVKDAVTFEAVAPDCTAAPMGMTLSARAWVRPLRSP